MRLELVAAACFVVGAVLMFLFEAALTRVIGVAALVAFIVCGVFALASPERLGDD